MLHRNPRPVLLGLAVALAASLGSAPVRAEKPEWAGQGGHGHAKKEKHEKQDRPHARKHDGKHREPRVGGYFNDRDRELVRVTYGEHFGGPKGCPPGLAKKNNGCLPPGQAKKHYMVGQPLPAGVVVYPVPQPVLVQLPAAPAGHKYVRIAADILLIAVGTSMVVDAISDLGRI